MRENTREKEDKINHQSIEKSVAMERGTIIYGHAIHNGETNLSKINAKLVWEEDIIPFYQQMRFFETHRSYSDYFCVLKDLSSLQYGLHPHQAQKSLLIAPEIVEKLEKKHCLPLWRLARIDQDFSHSVMMCASRMIHGSRIAVLVWADEKKPVLAALRSVEVNGTQAMEIASLYPKDDFTSFLLFTYMNNYPIYKTDQTLLFFKKHHIDLPFEISFAFSDLYPKTMIRRSDVQRFLKEQYQYRSVFSELPSKQDVLFPGQEWNHVKKALHALHGHLRVTDKNYLILEIPSQHLCEVYKHRNDVYQTLQEILKEQIVHSKLSLSKKTCRYFQIPHLKPSYQFQSKVSQRNISLSKDKESELSM